MTVHHFCTYFDHRYLPRGMVMLESLHTHCPQAHIHVLCLSEQCYAALSTLAYPYVSLLRLADLEAADPQLAATKNTRSLVEYYFTITPCLPWHLLTRDDAIKEITYLDADMMFFSSPEPIFEEAAGASVIITPHRFSKNLKDRECYGLYNVSWLTFTKTSDGLECLNWYRDACLAWCNDKLEKDRFADQKYLNIFPQRFHRVHIMECRGGGVAPWNLADATIEWRRSGPHINDSKIIFYHAHGFKHIFGPIFSSGLYEYKTNISSKGIYLLLKKYAQALHITAKQKEDILKWEKDTVIRHNDKSSTYAIAFKILQEYRKKTLIFI